MHRKCARKILGILKKVSELSLAVRRRRVTFACSPWPCIGCARGLGQMEKSGVSLSLSVFRVSMYICYEHIYIGGGVGRWKSRHRKIVPLSSLYRKTFKLKGNKKFRT